MIIVVRYYSGLLSRFSDQPSTCCLRAPTFCMLIMQAGLTSALTSLYDDAAACSSSNNNSNSAAQSPIHQQQAQQQQQQAAIDSKLISNLLDLSPAEMLDIMGAAISNSNTTTATAAAHQQQHDSNSNSSTQKRKQFLQRVAAAVQACDGAAITGLLYTLRDAQRQAAAATVTTAAATTGTTATADHNIHSSNSHYSVIAERGYTPVPSPLPSPIRAPILSHRHVHSSSSSHGNSSAGSTRSAVSSPQSSGSARRYVTEFERDFETASHHSDGSVASSQHSMELSAIMGYDHSDQ
jgi:hypothetical protein